jgi:RNA polymerase sigma-70 factor, ECF subfamily
MQMHALLQTKSMTTSADSTSMTRQLLDAFLRNIERRAFRIAQLAVKQSDHALDIVQDSMLAFVKNYSLKPHDEWPPLFYRVLDNKIQDFHRRSNVRQKFFFWQKPKSEDGDESADMIDLAASETSLPIDVLHSANAGDALNAALAALPGRQRQAFLLREWEGFDVAQTAQIMACSQGSVKTHLFRAMQNLRKQLEAFQ